MVPHKASVNGGTSLAPISDVAAYSGEPESSSPALLAEPSGSRSATGIDDGEADDEGDTTTGTAQAVAEAGAPYDPYAGLGALEGEGGYLGLNGGYGTDAPAPLRGMTGVF